MQSINVQITNIINIMRKSLLSSLLALLCLVIPALGIAQYREAFPGAEGFGRYTKGGRGGDVYHVTTLEDNNQPGSFRYACDRSGARTIVFDVSGTIHLNSELKLRNPYVTIAGQTAPGDGICIADYPFSIATHNVIIRFMRFRLGNKNVTLDGADGWDGLGAIDQRYIIVDHCSVSWSIDECLSFVGCRYTTVQWCIVSQSLVNSGHSKGSHGYGGNWGGAKASYHHNLLAHHVSRAPRLGPRPTTQLEEYVDMRNNVMYNYSGEGCYGGEGMKVNIVNNYYRPGPGNKYISSTSNAKGNRIAAIGVRNNKYIDTYPAYADALHLVGRYYVTGNANFERPNVYKDNWTYGMFDQITWSDWDDMANTAAKQEALKAEIKLDTPLEFEYTTTHSSVGAYSAVMDYAGASYSRDELDATIINEVKKNKAASTGAGQDPGFINSQDDVVLASGNKWPELKSTAAPVDSDQDGIPDEWETANGLNPNDASDGKAVTADGYTNLEHYINSLVDDIVTKGNAQGKLLNGTLTYADAAVTLPDYDPNAEYKYDMGSNNENGDGEDANELFLAFTNADQFNPSSPYTNLYTSTATSNNDGLKWESLGVEMVLVMDNKTFGGGNSCSGIDKIYQKPIKFSNGAPNRISLPEGFTTDKIDFIGYCNNDGAVAYISDISAEIDGNLESVYTGSDAEAVENVDRDTWGSMTLDDMPVISCNLSKPVGGAIWFKNGGKQPAFYIRIHKADESGIADIISNAPIATDNRVFNLMGIEMKNVDNLVPGIYIRDGKKFLVK